MELPFIVKPGVDGAALMSDRDVWISIARRSWFEAMNRGRADVAPTVRLICVRSAYMKREVSGMKATEACKRPFGDSKGL